MNLFLENGWKLWGLSPHKSIYIETEHFTPTIYVVYDSENPYLVVEISELSAMWTGNI